MWLADWKTEQCDSSKTMCTWSCMKAAGESQLLAWDKVFVLVQRVFVLVPARYFRNFWVGMRRWDPGTLSLYQSYKQLQNCWDTPRKKWPLLLQIAPGPLWDIIPTSLLPPIQSCSSKFWAWSCIASNFDKGWRGDHKHNIIDRPFMPKYGTVPQVLLQLVVVQLNFATLY